MPYHSHKLNSISHSHIIERTDPITGDSVKENDTVVFCAICKSCFLEESWVYMNERHCEQEKTLESIPALPSNLIVKKTTEEVIAELRNKKINFTITIFVTILSFVISFFSLITSDFSALAPIFLFVIFSLFIAFITGILSIFITLVTSSFKENTAESKNNIRLFKNRIEIGKDSFLWSAITQIKFQREIYIKGAFQIHPAGTATKSHGHKKKW